MNVLLFYWLCANKLSLNVSKTNVVLFKLTASTNGRRDVTSYDKDTNTLSRTVATNVSNDNDTSDHSWGSQGDYYKSAWLNIFRTLVVHTHSSRNMSCVCITRVLHMFTQAELLIVNHGHSYIDYDCAMCFWDHVEMFVIVLSCYRQTDDKRPAKPDF